MNSDQYRPTLDAMQLMSEVKRLLVAQRRADRLICRYLADLADGMANYPGFPMIYADVADLVHVRLGLSHRSIRERVRVGKALRALPLLDAALMSGDLTYSKVREVTRVAKPDNERLWLEAARRMSMRALELRVANASSAPRPAAYTPIGDIEPENPLLDVPAEVLELLKQAMRIARSRRERQLTDAEALAEVARGAITHFATSSSSESSRENATHSGSRGAEATEAGGTVAVSQPDMGMSRSDEGLTATHCGSPPETSNSDEGLTATHCGSPPGTSNSDEGLTATHCGSPPLRKHQAVLDTTVAEQELKSTHDGPAAPVLTQDEPLSEDAQLLLAVVRSEDSWYPDTLQQITAMPDARFSVALFDLLSRHLVTRGPLGLFEASKTGFKRAG